MKITKIWFRDLYPPQPTMYEIGRYFLQHKFVIKKHKNKRSKRR